MARLIDHYHRLPYPLRVVAASGKGLQIRRWRYGRETEGLMEEARARESGWTSEAWRSWSEQAVARVLERAATRVPYYRERWAKRRRRGDRASWDQLENWPILRKEELRRDPRAFVADDQNPRRMYELHTSGTTGTPLTIWITREDLRRWYAIYEVRVREWNGVSRHDRWGILGGQLVVPSSQSSPPYWVWNAAMHQLYMSTYHIGPATTAAYLAAMEAHRLAFVLVYPSAMYGLAKLSLEQDLRRPALRAVIGNAEPMLDVQRQTIEAAFNCSVRHTYGMSEIAAGGSECDHGTMHAWPEAGYLEFLAGPAESGNGPSKILCTGLINTGMPLIRYEVGDTGYPPEEDGCGCGRTLPGLGRIEGRMDDVVLTPDGRRVGRLDPVFKADMPIREAQVIQETRHDLRVLIVPASGYSVATESDIVTRLRDRVGEMEVSVDVVDAIPRAANGKFKAVVSLLDE